MEAKAREWERVFDEFRQEHGREPTVWLDEIVIDQSSLDDEAMMCLPANVMSCNKVMVLCGDTYIDMTVHTSSCEHLVSELPALSNNSTSGCVGNASPVSVLLGCVNIDIFAGHTVRVALSTLVVPE